MDTPIGQFLLIGNFRRRLARELLVPCCHPFLPAFNQDQLWGIISRRVGYEQNIQSADDVVTSERDELCKPTIRDWIGPATRIRVERLNATRDWRGHIPSLGVKLEGGLLRDDTGKHFFLSMQRRGENFG